MPHPAVFQPTIHHHHRPIMCEESSTNDYVHAKDVTPDEIINRYTNWARQGNYEKHLGEDFYKGPQYVAEHLGRLFSEVTKRKDVRVLDVAAGTGFVGEKLSCLGFANIDGLEPSQGMADILASKNVYSRIFMTRLDSEPTDIEPDCYDVLTVCGGMGENHIPCSGLEQMIRLVKPGGLIVIMMREAYLTTVEEYKDRLEPLMKELEKSGTWKMLSREVLPKYSFDNDGVLYTFKVL